MSSTGTTKKRGPEHPYLAGNFAPVTRTHSPTPCTYTGSIPRELLGGQYVRNGGNPITNSNLGRDAHWFDGDGMLAGVLFQRSASDPDQAIPHFVNQHILTDLCLSSFQNTLLRTPLLPSIATLVNPASSLIVIIIRILRSMLLVLFSHLSGSQTAIKRISVANTAVLFHDGRALATCESGPPMRIQLPGLETVGWYDGNKAEGETSALEYEDAKLDAFGGTGVFSWMREWTTGHPKVDPRTGELVLFHCNFLPPYVHYSVITPTHSRSLEAETAKLLNAPVPDCSGGKMMHDFGVSAAHTVILDLPLTLTPFNLVKNQPIVSYDAEKPARFGVFPRREPDKVRWFETSGCCIFHTANTWDEYGSEDSAVAVNMLACRLTSASLVFSAGNLTPPPHPKRKQATDPRPISFFAKYDDDDEGLQDIEKIPSHETPLLSDVNITPPITNPPPISDDDEEQCRLYYYRFDLDTSPSSSGNTITHQYALSPIPMEFPTLNPAYEMSSARYIYGCSTSNTSFGAALGKATKIDVLVKMDVQTLLSRGLHSPPTNITGCIDTRSMAEVLASHADEDSIKAFKMPAGWYAQEARFVPRSKAKSEDDGYLLFYAFDESQLNELGVCTSNAVSELWILDACTMRHVVCKVQLPARVPYGLHGNWFSESQILGQRGVERMREMPKQVLEDRTWAGKAKGRVIATLG